LPFVRNVIVIWDAKLYFFCDVFILVWNYIWIVVSSDGDLFFLELGSSSGSNRKYLPAADDSASIAIQIPNGFAFGNTTQTSVYVRKEYIQYLSTIYLRYTNIAVTVSLCVSFPGRFLVSPMTIMYYN